MLLWKKVNNALKDLFSEIFSQRPCRLVEKSIDSLTGKATFRVKYQRRYLLITTRDLFLRGDLIGFMSARDRQVVLEQLDNESQKTSSYIQEYPVAPNCKGEYIFKIFSLHDKKIRCGTASYFLKSEPKTVLSLSKEDVITLSIAYGDQLATEQQYEKPASCENVMFLRNARL